MEIINIPINKPIGNNICIICKKLPDYTIKNIYFCERCLLNIKKEVGRKLV